jgi:hypothetical protein
VYSQTDIESAVSAGAISSEAAEALRHHVERLRVAPVADEEDFRLISGFNDIFVTIACGIVIFACFAIGGDRNIWLSGLLVATTGWLMAEMFTRRRRMALPSIVLLLAFVIGAGFLAGALASLALPTHEARHVFMESMVWDRAAKTYVETPEPVERVWFSQERYPWEEALIALAAAVGAGLAAAAHWWRFRVAITIAALAGATVLLVLSLVAVASNQGLGTNRVLAPAALVCGLIVFGFAMCWDVSDRSRTTQRADVAFWLHLLAAPLIAYPLFYWMGVTGGGEIGIAAAIGVLLVYLVFAAIALTVDRRALLVSALAYGTVRISVCGRA